MSKIDTISSDHPVRRLYEQILIAWNQRDATAMAAYFQEDGNLVGYEGSQADSRAGIAISSIAVSLACLKDLS